MMRVVLMLKLHLLVLGREVSSRAVRVNIVRMRIGPGLIAEYLRIGRGGHVRRDADAGRSDERRVTLTIVFHWRLRLRTSFRNGSDHVDEIVDLVLQFDLLRNGRSQALLALNLLLRDLLPPGPRLLELAPVVDLGIGCASARVLEHLGAQLRPYRASWQIFAFLAWCCCCCCRRCCRCCCCCSGSSSLL